MNKFYITTTIPYVNSKAHLGHAREFIFADVIARYQKSLGKEIFLNTGTDEHGLKVYRKATEEGRDPKEYVDEFAEQFKQLMPLLGILPEHNFIRTTDEHHIAASQEFWKLCDKNGDIYKKNYKIKYCVGCELEKTGSEIVDGKCPIHPNLELEIIDEENYFFRFSKYQEPLLKYYETHPNFVVPDFRFNEIIQFTKEGLQDFSISRLKAKMPWGVPVPNDNNHVMYVWFDALVNYISSLGWPASAEATAGKPEESYFSQFWGIKEKPNALQVAGKDNLRQQSAMWQAMLMSAGLPNSKQIIILGFINSGGQKMSKSLGNVADPIEILAKLKSNGLSDSQATDALRYYLIGEIPVFEDGDYAWEKFEENYNASLANGLGNLFERVFTMILTNPDKIDLTTSEVVNIDKNVKEWVTETELNYKNEMENYRLLEAS
ncbi:methionine--tRNA ligase, partial [Candidatus Wolfebacteria bacterium]|nr:methionine--tRNA ligase [Candidatus Wolfebacteria bacterium]